MKKEIGNKKLKTTKKPAKKIAAKSSVSKKKVATVKKAPTPPALPQKKFSMNLEMAYEIFHTTGETIIECLEGIVPTMLKSKGTFVITSEGKVASKVMYPFEIKRLLSGKVSKIVFEKRMLAVMK